jgi:hypothetical protein
MAARRADTTLVAVPLVGVIVEGKRLVFSRYREERLAILSAAAREFRRSRCVG